MLCVECFADFREVEFGRYYQRANSHELSPIEWFVLDETDKALLLITKSCIDEVPYNEQRINITWENSTLRKWLNEEFLNTAFNRAEQSAIIPGNEKIFVLSREEVTKYMPDDESRKCRPTEYSRYRGTYVNESGLCAWWTRSLANNRQALYLSSYGTFGTRPHYVDDKVIGIRPALWVDKNFFAGENLQSAEKILYSAKPDAQKAYEAENTLFPLMEQSEPFGVKEVCDYFFANPRRALDEFDRKRFEVQGVVLRTGPDGVFGEPCIELSDKLGGKCYVLCIFRDEKLYRSVKAGDKISVRGNYLVIREDYGIVLKICELI